MFWVSNVSLFLIPTEVGVSAILYTNIFPSYKQARQMSLWCFLTYVLNGTQSDQDDTKQLDKLKHVK